MEIHIPPELEGKEFCGLSEFALILGLSVRTTHEILDAGLPHLQFKEGGKVKIPIRKALKWYIKAYKKGDW